MQKPAPTPSVDHLADYQIDDPEEYARNMLALMEESGKVMGGMIERADSQVGPYSAASEMAEAVRMMSELWQSWLAEPDRLANAQTELMQSYAELWNNTMRRMMGEDVAPVATPHAGDNRFKDPAWSANPFFDYLKQSYLIGTQWAEKLLGETDHLDALEKRRAEFYMRLLSSALAPSNFPMTNPEVLRETMRSNGRNLLQGMHNLARDLERSGDLLKISQTDTEAFEVGRNIAVTPGKVVFQNDIFQLIQYAPQTEKVRKVPLLIVPPWINKFYILDLNAQKSFISFAVREGFTVFIMSWINPDQSHAETTFEDYMQRGILAAVDAVKRETLEPQLNVLGYCVGGTLLACTLAYAAARGDDRFKSASFLTTQVDFSRAGDLKLFVDEAQLQSLEEMMAERGYLDGSRMANVFNMMRPRDLIWPYIVNNYMLGKTPFPFDLLYWNQDSTRMPARNHVFYLREFYQRNKLAKGELRLGGVRLNLANVKIPVYDLAAREDHIAPADSVFVGSRLFGGPIQYVLAGSGHIAGVINPPSAEKPKYQFWTRTSPADTLAEWLEGADETKGSWWPHWSDWLAGQSGGWVAARTPGAGLGVIEDAPGSYVKVRA